METVCERLEGPGGAGLRWMSVCDCEIGRGLDFEGFGGKGRSINALKSVNGSNRHGTGGPGDKAAEGGCVPGLGTSTRAAGHGGLAAASYRSSGLLQDGSDSCHLQREGQKVPDTFFACRTAVNAMPLNKARGPSSLAMREAVRAALRYLGTSPVSLLLIF